MHTVIVFDRDTYVLIHIKTPQQCLTLYSYEFWIEWEVYLIMLGMVCLY